jgi:cytochrome P450
MTITNPAQDAASMLKPLTSAVQLNLAAAIRNRRLGHRGWTGAVNTAYDPLDPDTAAHPFAAYDALHRGGRVHYNPRRQTWILHRLDDVRAALRDTDQVTSSQGVTRIRMAADLVVVTDGDQHSRLRKQVQPAFTKRALDSWHTIIEDLAAELVDDMITEPGSDAVARLAIPMPLRLIAAILGIPDDDIADFRRWSEDSVRLIDFSPTPKGILNTARAVRAAVALRRYFLSHLTAGDLKGTNTVLGRLLEHNTDGSLTDEQLFYIAILLLIAGNETTTNLLGGMIDTLARHPDQYDKIRADPDLIPLATEEQLRYTSPIQNLYRYTRAPYQVGEARFPPARDCCCPSARPTVIRRPSTTPTPTAQTATRACTWPSATARICVWAHHWRGWKPTQCFANSSAGSPASRPTDPRRGPPTVHYAGPRTCPSHCTPAESHPTRVTIPRFRVLTARSHPDPRPPQPLTRGLA